MKTASWKAAGAAAGRVAISLGTRGVAAGYRKFAPLQPPGWMLKLPGHEFNRAYRAQLDATPAQPPGTAEARGGPGSNLHQGSLADGGA